VILTDFHKALMQFDDRRFTHVVLKGVLLCLMLLAAIFAAVFWGIGRYAPDQLTLPWIGTLHGLHWLFDGGAALLMLIASVVLMVPVASAFSGLFLEDVVEAVESRYYPDLPKADPIPLMVGMRDALSVMVLMCFANALALILYVFSGPFAPLVFWAVNGLLLGREYFTLVGLRRLGRAGATRLRRRHFAQIWLAGFLMAMVLSVPVVNLIVPVLAVASYTHMFQRLNRRASISAGGAVPTGRS
jgi:CysZ protein